MSFIQREYDRLMEVCQNTPPGPAYDIAYAAKGALIWALDPDGYASPSATLAKFYGVEIEGTKGTGIDMTNGSPASQPAPSN